MKNLEKSLFRIGIAGFGHSGKAHTKVFNNFKEVGKIQIADPLINQNSSTLQTISKKDCLFKDYKELLNCDAVVISLPAELQKEAIFYFSKKKIPMLIEKPMGVTYKDSLKIVETLEKEQVPAMCGLTGLYHPEFKAMYSQLKTIGDLIEVKEKLHEANPDLVNLLLNENKGVLNLNGIHTLHRFYKIASLKNKNEFLKVINVELGHKYFKKLGEDSAKGELHLGNVPFKFEMSFRNGNKCDNGLPIDYITEIKGKKGTIIVTGWEKCETHYNNRFKIINYQNPNGPLDEDSQYSRISLGLKEENKEFLRFIKSGEKKHPTLNELLEGKKLVEECYKLAQK